MKYLPPLKSLNVFLAAAQQQSFKAAAKQLHVTQAAVSQQIRQLEEYFQCELFERLNRQTRLTAQGRALLPYIERAFAEITAGVDAISGDPQPNLLRISTLHSFTSHWLIPKIGDFQQKYPEIMVQFAPNNQVSTFHDANLDVAIRLGLGRYPGLESKMVTNNKILLLASPMLLGSADLTAEQVFSFPLLEDTSLDMQEALNDCCRTFGVEREKVNSLIKTNDAVPIIAHVIAGRGVALVNSILVADSIENGQLIPLLSYSYVNPYSLYLVAPPQHFDWQKVRLFEKWLMSNMQNSLETINKF